MLNSQQLKTLIIIPALKDLVLYSDDAVALLLFTCATESIGGTYLHQEKGPALGIYQMEPTTYNDLWVNFILNKNSIVLQLSHNFACGYMPSEERLIYDLRFATAMARIFYARIKAPLPNANDIEALWDYYKLYYNTAKGAATKDKSIALYQQFIAS